MKITRTSAAHGFGRQLVWVILFCLVMTCGTREGAKALFRDNLDDLVRMAEPVEAFGSVLWLLTHEDLRTTPRFRAFLDFMAERLTAGRSKSADLEQ